MFKLFILIFDCLFIYILIGLKPNRQILVPVWFRITWPASNQKRGQVYTIGSCLGWIELNWARLDRIKSGSHRLDRTIQPSWAGPRQVRWVGITGPAWVGSVPMRSRFLTILYECDTEAAAATTDSKDYNEKLHIIEYVRTNNNLQWRFPPLGRKIQTK